MKHEYINDGAELYSHDYINDEVIDQFTGPADGDIMVISRDEIHNLNSALSSLTAQEEPSAVRPDIKREYINQEVVDQVAQEQEDRHRGRCGCEEMGGVTRKWVWFHKGDQVSSVISLSTSKVQVKFRIAV